MSGFPGEKNVRLWTGRSERKKNKSLYKEKQIEKRKQEKEKNKRNICGVISEKVKNVNKKYNSMLLKGNRRIVPQENEDNIINGKKNQTRIFDVKVEEVSHENESESQPRKLEQSTPGGGSGGLMEQRVILDEQCIDDFIHPMHKKYMEIQVNTQQA